MRSPQGTAIAPDAGRERRHAASSLWFYLDVILLAGDRRARRDVRAVLFDLFETLVTHVDPHWSPPPQTIAERLGIEQETFDRHWRNADALWQAGALTGYIDALDYVCVFSGVPGDEPVLTQLRHEYEQMTDHVFQNIEPAIEEMLVALKREGLLLGVVTNAGDLDVAPWKDCRLAQYIDDLVASHEVGLLKRESRIFELACSRLGVTNAETIFIGDGGGDELRGATEAGLRAYWSTWFLDRWPEGVTPNHFPGGEWRQTRFKDTGPYPRLANPNDVLRLILVDL
jgi:HAD superfamily hydrolase (TIGR01549 family)